MGKTKLYILTGFLGSGKTTVLQKILEKLEGKRTGIIQNELGKLSIDGTVLRDDDIKMVELTRGSIFCSCLKLSFVQALTEMAKEAFDYLFVESSGFGDPSNLEEILEAVRITAGGDVYDFQGTICLVDCVNFMDQIVDQETVDRQLKHCNLAVLTKTDLSDEQKIMEICGKIREINPVCPIVQSENGNLSLDFLNQDLLKYQWAECEETTNSVETKPKTLYMEFEGEVAKESLDEFLRTMSPDVHRIKGFFQVQEEGWQKVDVVGKKIDYAPYEPQEKTQLVFISKIGTAVIKKIFAAWEDKVGLPMKLKN